MHTIGKSILLVSPAMHKGGPFEDLKRQAHLSKRLFSSVNTLFLNNKPSEFLGIDAVNEEHFDIWSLKTPFYFLYNLQLPSIVKAAIGRCNPQIILSYASLWDYWIAGEAKKAGAKTISVIHTFSKFRAKKIATHYYRKAFDNSWGVIFISNAIIRYFEEYHGVLPQRTFVVNSPIETEKLFHNPNKRTDGRTILYAGRLSPMKGTELALYAFAQILNKMPDAKLLIAGEGMIENQLKSLTVKLNIHNKVEFLGYYPNLPELLNLVDVLIHTSPYETFSRIIAESLCCEVPVVTCSKGGPEEILEGGIGGFLVEPTPEAIADKIIYLLKNPEIRTKLGKEGRERIVERYSIKNFEEKMTAIYKQALEG